MSMRWFLALGLSMAVVAAVAASGGSEERNLPNGNTARTEETPSLGSVNGKYRVLLHRLYVPQDEANYKRYFDYGMYTGTSYLQWNNLHQGYWVYAYPYWYIWRDCVKPGARGAPGGGAPGVNPPVPDIELRPLTK